MSKHPTSPTAFSGLFSEKEKWKWHPAPIKTEWGEDMAVASVPIDKDHTVDLYCERGQTARVEAMFTQQPMQEPDLIPQDKLFVSGQMGAHVTRVHVEQPVQEPFGYLYPTGMHPEFRYFQNKRDDVDGMPLYTAPQPRQWRGLARLEFQKAVDGLEDLEDCWIAIEAALREKNT